MKSIVKGKKDDKLFVVITHNTKDILHMSTGRTWTSCLKLPDTSRIKSSKVYCESIEGGFAAYLINSNDLDIKKPWQEFI